MPSEDAVDCHCAAGTHTLLMMAAKRDCRCAAHLARMPWTAAEALDTEDCEDLEPQRCPERIWSLEDASRLPLAAVDLEDLEPRGCRAAAVDLEDLEPRCRDHLNCL